VRDRELINRLDRRLFPEDVPLVDEVDDLEDDSIYCVVAYVDGVPAGMGVAEVDPGEIVGFLRGGVLREFRGRGIHKRLIRARLRHGKRMKCAIATCYTTSDNKACMVSLIRCGFIPHDNSVDGYNKPQFVYFAYYYDEY